MELDKLTSEPVATDEIEATWDAPREIEKMRAFVESKLASSALQEVAL